MNIDIDVGEKFFLYNLQNIAYKRPLSFPIFLIKFYVPAGICVIPHIETRESGLSSFIPKSRLAWNIYEIRIAKQRTKLKWKSIRMCSSSSSYSCNCSCVTSV